MYIEGLSKTSCLLVVTVSSYNTNYLALKFTGYITT